MNFYLVTFTPLCYKNEDGYAIIHNNQPKFVDSSSRREPELESEYPSISSICRADKLTSRLAEGDIIAYISKKWGYSALKNHRRLVAILKIIKKCENHEEAAQFYKAKNLKIPSNCIVNGSQPYERQYIGLDCYDEQKYKDRVNDYPLYFICKHIYHDLLGTIQLHDAHMKNIFGETDPPTENPPAREITELEKLVDFANEYLIEKEKISLGSWFEIKFKK